MPNLPNRVARPHELSDEKLVSALISAACTGNEMDNREEVATLKIEVLMRLSIRADLISQLGKKP